jgi:hypothetical protein
MAFISAGFVGITIDLLKINSMPKLKKKESRTSLI